MEEKELIVEDDTFELRMRKVGNWFGKNLPTIFAILISFFFLFSGMVQILPTTMALKEQIIMAIINIFAGFSITSLISEHGFTSAKGTNAYNKEIQEYNNAVQKGLKYREGIENLAKKKATDNLRNYRIRLLESVGLRYNDLFDTYDTIKDYDITQHRNDQNYHKKKRVFRKVLSVKTYSTNVFGRASSNTYGLKKEITEKEFRTKNGIIKGITKLILGTISVGVIFVWLGFTLGALIYAFMQVVLWTGMGLIDSQKNFNFILNEIVPQYESNRLIILEFMELPDSEKEKYIPSQYLQIEMKDSALPNENNVLK